MHRRMASLVLITLLGMLLSACGEQTTATRAPAADLGLARRGLSPSEVALPCVQAEGDHGLEIVSCRGFRHMGETIHLLGEVRNTTDQPLGDVTVTLAGYTEGGQEITREEDTVYIEPVPPGGTQPFRIFFNARDVDRVEASAVGEPTDAELPETLDVSNVGLSEPEQGYTHITFDLVNSTDDDVQVTVIAVLRDENGEAVEVHRERVVKPLASGENSLDIMALHHGAADVDVTVIPRE